MARPSLLVGHFPLTGAGRNDVYEIYGNFFWQNPTEALFQGEGNIALYDNVFVNDFGDAVNIQPQLDVPWMIRIFDNMLHRLSEQTTRCSVAWHDSAPVPPFVARVPAALPRRGGLRVQRNHLQAYLNEFAFRHNRRFGKCSAFQRLLQLGLVTRAPSYRDLYDARGLGESVHP